MPFIIPVIAEIDCFTSVLSFDIYRRCDKMAANLNVSLIFIRAI